MYTNKKDRNRHVVNRSSEKAFPGCSSRIDSTSVSCPGMECAERESHECPDIQIGANQCQSSVEEVSAARSIGVRAPRNSVLDPFMLSTGEESTTFQNYFFDLLEQINELKEQLRQSEVENQQLKAELGRHLFLEDREKRSDKLLSLPRASASDESRCFGASTSSKCVSSTGRLLGGAASLQGKPDM